MSLRIRITSILALCAMLSSTALVLLAGIAAACSGTGGGGGCSAPSVSTGGYDSLTSSSVTLTGSVNPQGCQTYYAFEYGRSSEGYPDEIISSAGSGTSPVTVSTSSAIVQPSTSYHYRLSAWSEGGEVTGGSGSFTTPAACAKPTVTTEAASSITMSSAKLNGKINPNGCSTSYTFEYGLAASGTYTKVNGSAGTISGSVSKEVTGLQAGKLYTFNLKATNSMGTSEGTWLNFATAPGYDPILFVHGWKGDATTFGPMLEKFHADGWPYSHLYNFAYDSALSNVTIAQDVANRVNQLILWTGASKVDIITHSMGGLASRYYIKNLGGASKVEDFVSLGGPNHGTAMGGAIWCTYPISCGEMKNDPMSSFLIALNSGDETPGSVRYLTVRSECDPIINPDDSVILNGAVANLAWNPPLTSCPDSHSLLHEDSWVYSQVKQFVR